MKSAFTLIEILIVVILLGILAAIVVPQFTDASDDAKLAAQDTDVAALKTAVQLYRAQIGSYPATLAALAATATAANGTTYGPWIEAVPTNPVTNAAYTYDAATGIVSE